MLVELPMVTIAPPDSTNFLSCGMVLSSVMRPVQLLILVGDVLRRPRRPKPPPSAAAARRQRRGSRHR